MLQKDKYDLRKYAHCSKPQQQTCRINLTLINNHYCFEPASSERGAGVKIQINMNIYLNLCLCIASSVGRSSPGGVGSYNARATNGINRHRASPKPGSAPSYQVHWKCLLQSTALRSGLGFPRRVLFRSALRDQQQQQQQHRVDPSEAVFSPFPMIVFPRFIWHTIIVSIFAPSPLINRFRSMAILNANDGGQERANGG